MAAAGEPFRVAGLGRPESTVRRRVHELVDWGLVEPVPGQRGVFVGTDPMWIHTAREVLAERPDAEDLLADSSTLPVLASLPDGPGPLRRRCAGVSAPTWRRQLERLHAANVVLRRPGTAWLNDGLPALGRLVQAFREQQVRWDDQWASPEDADRHVTWLPIHQCGTEAAWRVRNGIPQGIETLDWNTPYFRALTISFRVGYRGQRELDALDAALLHVRGEYDLAYQYQADAPERMDPRVLGLVLAGCGEEALGTRRFEARFDFYGLGPVYDHLMHAQRNRSGATWMFRGSLIREHGVPEGCLA